MFFRRFLSFSKHFSWGYLLLSFLLGILFSFSPLLGKLDSPFKTIATAEQTSQQQSCDYTVTRVDGYQHIRPLLSIDQSCESAKFEPLKANLTTLLDNSKREGDITQASVYLRKFKQGEWFALNDEERYHPASLMKVALLLSYLRMAEATPGLLTQKWVFEKPRSVEINPQYYAAPTIEEGKAYTVHELLYYMVAHSDNNATWLLTSKLDVSVTKKLFADLGLPEPVEDKDDLKFTLTAKEYSVFFKAIYNSACLSPEYSEYAAALLSNCTFKEGFAKGFPENTEMWHKFGEWRSAGQDCELHESGVVYIHDVPYLVTVMTKGKDTDRLAKTIRAVSKVIYENVSP